MNPYVVLIPISAFVALVGKCLLLQGKRDDEQIDKLEEKVDDQAS